MKQNDWIVAGILNPDLNPGELKASGLNLDNTLMLMKEDYMKSSFILNNDAFKDEDGNFSRTKFEDYYLQRLSDFNTFKSSLPTFLYDLFDVRRMSNPKAQIKDTGFELFKVVNPDESTIGNGWINQEVESPLSDRERAEKNKIFDTATGKWLEYSPNDHALTSNPVAWFKDILSDPLVLATYDEDEKDALGNIIHHKGDKKLNDLGKYYYETLNGRNISGKQVLSGWDTLTVDGTAFNKIDVFDSDDREKSIGGIIAKGVLTLAPLFVSPEISLAYGTVLTLREIAKTLPMVDGVLGAITGNNEDTAFTRLANNLAGKAMAATLDTSDKALGSDWKTLLSLENVSNLLEDVALQWSQQKAVANAINKLKGTTNIAKEAEATAKDIFDKDLADARQRAYKEAETLEAANKTTLAQAARKAADTRLTLMYGDATADWKTTQAGLRAYSEAMSGVLENVAESSKLGADASLVYMSLVSNADVYGDMLDHGLTKREATAVTLASTLSMFGVDKYLGLGDHFFNETTSDNMRSIRATLKKEGLAWRDSVGKSIAEDTTLSKGDKVKKMFTSAKDWFSDKWGDFAEDLKTNSLGILGHSVGEGLEEVNEELCSDLSKQLYEWAAEIKPINDLFGGLTTTNVDAFSNAFASKTWVSDLVSRYGANFLGGFLGGGVFAAKEKFQNKSWSRNKDHDLLTYIVRNNKTEDVLKVLDEYRDKGKLGSTQLGITPQKDDNGNVVYITKQDNELSQNDFIYNQLKYEILGLDKIIRDANLNLTDEELKQNLSLGEYRFLQLLENLNGASYQQEYQDRYTDLVSKYALTELTLLDLRKDLTDNEKRNLIDEIQNNILKLEATKTDLLKLIEDFKSGETAIDYMSQILWEMDDAVSAPFKVITFKSFLANYKKDGLDSPITLDAYSNMSSDEQLALIKEYQAKKDDSPVSKAEAWAQYKEFRDNMIPELTSIAGDVLGYKLYINDLNDLFDKDLDPRRNMRTFNLEDFSETATDPEFKIDYYAVTPLERVDFINELPQLDGEDDADYEIRLNLHIKSSLDKQSTESPEDYLQRRNARIEKLKLYRKNYLDELEEIKALLKISDIIQNSGGLLDENTRRHLKLNLGQRQLDRVKRFLSLVNVSRVSDFTKSTINAKLQSLKGDLSNFDSVKTDILDAVQAESVNLISKKVSKNVNLLKRLEFFALDTSNENFYAIRKFVEYDDEVNKTGLKETSLLGHLESFFKYLPQLDDSGNPLPVSQAWAYFDSFLKDDGTLDISNSNLVNGEIPTSTLLPEEAQFIENLRKLQKSNPELIKRLKDGEVANLFKQSDLRTEIFKSFFGEDVANVFNLFKDGKLDTDKILLDLYYVSPKDGIYYSLIDYDDGNGNIIKGITKTIEDEDTWRYNIVLSEDNLQNLTEYKDLLKYELTGTSNALETWKSQHVESDYIWNFIKKINGFQHLENPIFKVIRKIAMQMNILYSDIEDVLNKLMDKMDSKGADEFTFSPEEESAINEAYDLLQLAYSVVYAAMNNNDPKNPFPHHLFYNDIIKKHGLKLDELPLIDLEVGNLMLNLIEALRAEIGNVVTNEGVGNPYNIGSWRFWNFENQLNKALQFIKTDKAFTTAKVDLFKNVIINYSKGTIDGVDFDLLYGADLNNSDKELALVSIEENWFNNLNTLLTKLTKNDPTKRGEYFKKILDAIGLGNLIGREPDIKVLKTSSLNEFIKSSDLTSMDIGMYLLAISGISTADFNKFIESNLTKSDKAPLTEQEHVTRSALSYINDTTLYTSGLEWMFDQWGYKGTDVPLLLKGLFISGNGGAGKSDVVIRNITKYCLDKVILSGPTQDQVDNLKKVSDKALRFKKEELFDKLIEDSALVLNKGTEYVQKVHSFADNDGENYLEVVDPTKLKFKDNDTKAIIIDEATHFTTYELSILSAYCDNKGIALILVGDNLLQGARSDRGPNNLGSETAFVGRTPRLSNTLRDSNVLKLHTVDVMVPILMTAEYIPESSNDREIRIKLLIKDAKKIKTYYYRKTEINGDYIVRSLSKEDAAKIKSETGKVGYLGDTSTSTYLTLVSVFGEDKIDVIQSETNLLGKEYDNIVIDTNWEKVDFNASSDAVHGKLSTFLKRYYTLSTRGRKSAIFIDPHNVIAQNGITNEELFLANHETHFNPEAIEKFKASKLVYLDKVKSKYINTSGNTAVPTSAPTPTGPTGPMGPTSSRNVEQIIVLPKANVVYGPRASRPTETSDVEDAINAINATTEEGHITRLEEADEGLVYGEFSRRGVPSVTDEKTGEVQWIIPPRIDADGKRHILKDIEIFTEDWGTSAEFVSSRMPALHDENEKFNNRLEQLVDELIRLKSLFLFHNESITDSLIALYIPSHFLGGTKIFTADNLNKAKFKVVVSTEEDELASGDGFVGYSQLSLSKMFINGGGARNKKALCYKIIVEFNINSFDENSGEIIQLPVQLTLGALGNPEAYAETIISDIKDPRYGKSLYALRDKLKADLEKLKKIDGLEASVKASSKHKDEILNPDVRTFLRKQKNLARVEALIANRTSLNHDGKNLIQEYLDNLDEIYDRWEKYGETETIIKDLEDPDSNGDILFIGDTEIRTSVRGEKDSVLKVRLQSIPGGLEDYEASSSFLPDTTLENSKYRGSSAGNVVVSPIYIIDNKNGAESYDSMYSMNGKAVIFVTRDKSLSPSDLALIWSDLVADGNLSRRVRCIHLDNMGVPFEWLCQREEYYDILGTNVSMKDSEIKQLPIETKYMGIRALIAFHNFVAYMKLFRDLLESKRNFRFKGLSNKDIDLYLITLHEANQTWRQSGNIDSAWASSDEGEEAFKEWVRANPIPELDLEIVEGIWKFNEEDCSLYKEFRLGIGNIREGRLKHGERFGFLVRKLHNESKDLYEDKDNYGIYISTLKLGLFIGIADLFNQIINLMFLFKKGADSNEVFEDDEEIIVRDKFGNPTTNLSGYIESILNSESKGSMAGFALENDGDWNPALLCLVPNMFFKLASRAIAHSNLRSDNTLEITDKFLEGIKNPKYREKYAELKHLGKGREWNAKKANTLHLKEIVEMGEDGKPAKVVDHAFSVENIVNGDLDVSDLLNLCFHGTVDEFIDSLLYGKPITKGAVAINPKTKLVKKLTRPIQAEDCEFPYGFLSDPRMKHDTGSDDNSVRLKTLHPGGVFGTLYPCATAPWFFSIKAAVDLPRFRIKFKGKFKHDEDSTTLELFKEEGYIPKKQKLTIDQEFIQNYSTRESIFTKLDRDGILLKDLKVGKDLLGIFGTLEGLSYTETADHGRGTITLGSKRVDIYYNSTYTNGYKLEEQIEDLSIRNAKALRNAINKIVDDKIDDPDVRETVKNEMGILTEGFIKVEVWHDNATKEFRFDSEKLDNKTIKNIFDNFFATAEDGIDEEEYCLSIKVGEKDVALLRTKTDEDPGNVSLDTIDFYNDYFSKMLKSEDPVVCSI